MPPQHIDTSSIFKELEEHNEFFDDFVDMFPVSVYVGNKSSSQDEYQNGAKISKKQSPKSKKDKGMKSNKFDPQQQETTLQRKRRLEEDPGDHSDDDDDDMDNFHIEDNHEEEADEETEEAANSKKKEGKNSSHQSRIEQLREKLRAKLEEKKKNSVINGKSDTIVSKRAARRAEKKRRIEQAKKKANANISGGKTATGKDGLATIKIVKDLGGSRINSDTNRAKSISDDLAGIDFGGIAGLKDDLLKRGSYGGVNKSLKNLGKKKSLERLLEEAEAKKARLRELKESDDLEDKEKAKNIEWGEALKAASGAKIRETDTTILKKAIKRKQKKKQKSAEAWKSRMEQTKEKMDERMSIRNHNLKQRAIGGTAGASLSKRRIKDDEEANAVGAAGADKKKRPRLGPYAGKGRAGFEGKKQDFINKGSSKKGVKGQ